MYYVYLLEHSKNKKWYTGATSDLRKRLVEHNRKFQKRGYCYKLIYYEACLQKEDAWSREKYLKSGMGKRYLKNRLKRFLSLTGCILNA